MNLLQRVIARLRAWIVLLVFRFSIRREIHGIQLVVPSANDEAQRFFDKAREAFGLIQAADARRWTKIRRYLSRMVLINGGGEFYHAQLRAYVVDLPSLRSRSPLELATSIVHEATHARIDRAGILYAPKLRDRIEALCVREEVAFLRRLPNTQELIAKKEAALSTRWWSEESLHQRRLEGLRSHGVPMILVRMFDRFRRLIRAS